MTAPDPPAPVGRRERKKQQTRNALAGAALDLFLERGIDEVTVADITAVVDVDRSTFFRYFTAKEAVLFTDREIVLTSIRRLIVERPPDEPLRLAIVNAYAELIGMIELDPQLERMRQQLAEQSPTVRTYLVTFTEDVRVEIRAAIAERLGVDADVDPRPDVIAGAVIAAVTWVRTPSLRVDGPVDRDKVVTQIDRAIAAASDFFTETATPRAPRSRRRPAGSGS